MRTVFHVDMDAFFVSVEELYDPGLRGKAVVVGGQRNERGVVSAASYEARKFGVHSAMPLRTAAKMCPHAVFLNGHPDRYREYSHRVHGVLTQFSPRVEMASVDEAYVDVTGTERLHGPPMKAAHTLHEMMKGNTGLNCSIGIGTTRMVAKVASDQAKPNGVLWVQPGLESGFLAPLEVRKIPGVGKVTEKKLREIGIRRVGDLAALNEDFLAKRLGQWGLELAGKARGADAGAWFAGAIGDHEDAKSISHEHTFERDTADAMLLESTLARLAEKVARRLREQGFYARTVHLKLRYSDFTTLTRAHTPADPTQLDQELIAETRSLFRKTWKKGSAVRLLGVGASGMATGEGQLSLLEGERKERARKALTAADQIRDRFGEKSVTLAAGMRGDFGERVHENPVGLPGKAPKKKNEGPSSH